MTRDLADLVAAHPLAIGLPEAVVRQLAGCARNVAFSRGEMLVAEDEPADALYLLRRGRVAIEIHGPEGALVVETVGPGAIVGWSWLVPPYRYRFDARALEAVGAVEVDAACLRAKAQSDPELGWLLLQRVAGALVERLQATRLRLLDLYGNRAAS